MTPKIQFGVGGPSRLPRKLPVSTCPVGPPEEWPILCSRPVELFYHWWEPDETYTKGHSTAHREPVQFCRGCRNGLCRNYACYVGVWDQRADCKLLKQLPGDAVIGCKELWCDDTTDLRGLILRWGRRGTTRNRPVWAQILTPSKPWDNFPPEFDLEAAVARLFGHDTAMTDALRTQLMERTPRSHDDGELIPLPPDGPAR